MASAKMMTGPRRRLWPWVLLGVVAVVGALALYFWPAATAYSRTGSAYAARVICSCRHIGGRTLEDCKKDLEPGMEIVSVSEAFEERRVTASVPLLAKESAVFRPGSGCVLEDWDGK